MNTWWTTFFDIFTINIQKSDSDKNQDVVDDECGTLLLSLHSEEMLHWGKNTHLGFLPDRWDSVHMFTPLICCVTTHTLLVYEAASRQLVHIGDITLWTGYRWLPKFWVPWLLIYENTLSTLKDTMWTSTAVKTSYFTLIVCT
jgi:hypothetical protein